MNNRLNEENQITPDEAFRELARRELLRRQSLTQEKGQKISQNQNQLQQNVQNKNDFKRELENIIGMNRTPFNTLQDLGAGILRGGQNLAALLGEGGQAIASFLTGGRAPVVNIREELGLEKDNPVDLSKVFSSKNANPFLIEAGQFVPGIIAGGLSIPRQMAANAIWSGIQAQPNQKNALGFLPSGRIGAAIEGGAAGALPLVAKPLIAGSKSIINLPKAFSKINPKEIAESVQQSHDFLYKTARDLFNKVGKLAAKRNIDSIPIRKNLIADIADLEQLPTKKYQSLLDKAYSGDYQALRDLQSDLWKKATSGFKSPLRVEQNAAEIMMELRDEINDSIINHFKKTGNLDLAEDLTKAKIHFKNLMDTYYGKKVNPAIKNLVHEDSRKVPKNIMDILSEQSKPMDRLRKEVNPIVSKKVKDYQSKQKAIKDLKKIGIAGAIATPIGIGGSLYKNIFNK